VTGTDTIALQQRQVAQELYRIIQALDPATFKEEVSAAIDEMMERLQSRIQELLEEHPVPEGVKAQLRSLRETTEEWKARFRDRFSKRERTSLFKRLQWAYESMAKSMRERKSSVAILRQTNHKRSLFHAMNGFIGLTIVQLAPGTVGVMIFVSCLMAMAAGMEISRRLNPAINDKLMRFFDPIAHPHEAHKINSASWYLAALTVLVFTVDPLAQSVALIVLGLGDPAAGITGRRWGGRKIFRNKSWVGAGTFFLVAFGATAATLALFYGDLTGGTILLVATVAATTGALAETFTLGLDDNFTIPIAVGFATTAAMAWM